MNPLVLVVDDEPDVEVLFRQQFRRDLRAGRFTMEFAQSAQAALQCISDAGDASLILILSDINMPGMSGLELLPKAKALRPDVPIIMITAYGDVETKRQALEKGAKALLTKPIDFKTLRGEIDMRSNAPHNLPEFAAVRESLVGPFRSCLNCRGRSVCVAAMSTGCPLAPLLKFGTSFRREGKPKGCRGPLNKFGIEKDVERRDLAIANNDDIQSGVVWGLAFRA